VNETKLLTHDLFRPFSEKLLDINVLYDLTIIVVRTFTERRT
jgi:hypothetical protein